MNTLQEKFIAKVDWLKILISLIMLFAVFALPDPYKAIVVVTGFFATLIVVIYSRKKLRELNDK